VENKKNFKNGYANKYHQTVPGIGLHVVSPEEEKKGCGGKGLQKRKVLGLE